MTNSCSLLTLNFCHAPERLPASYVEARRLAMMPSSFIRAASSTRMAGGPSKLAESSTGDPGQHVLPFLQSQSAEIPSVQIDQVECVIHDPAILAERRAVLKHLERG